MWSSEHGIRSWRRKRGKEKKESKKRSREHELKEARQDLLYGMPRSLSA